VTLVTLVSSLLFRAVEKCGEGGEMRKTATNKENQHLGQRHTSSVQLPSFDRYYIDLAECVGRRANCLGKKVGAVIIVGNRIVSTGYNGVPEGMTNCMDGGCKVCLWKNALRKEEKYKRKKSGSGKGYDDCICVHAEQNALMTAARFGISIEGGTLYTSWQPCFGCTKQMLQAKIQKIVFKNDFTPNSRLWEAYQEIQDEFPGGVWKFENGDQLEMLSKKKRAVRRRLSLVPPR